jgi:hypothetical protein
MTSLRAALNNVSIYRGTTYSYPQKAIVPLVAACLQDLGFTVTTLVNSYYNHIVLSDYSEDVVLQIYNSAASTNQVSMLFPRNASSVVSVGGTFNSGTSCRATLRMLGEGPGKTRTLLILGSTSTPALTYSYLVYFTDAKFLPTGEMKKAVVIVNGANAYLYLYENDWTFLPGFDSDLTTYVTSNTYWQQISAGNGYKSYHDPYSNYYLMQSDKFPIIPAVSGDGLWEFPDIIFNPYGIISESATAEAMKYSLTGGNIYQIGSHKYLCNSVGMNNYLFRVE